MADRFSTAPLSNSRIFLLNSLNDYLLLSNLKALGRADDLELALEHEHVTVKDLFQSQDNRMFSSEVQRLSDEALKGLDEALVRVEDVTKSVS